LIGAALRNRCWMAWSDISTIDALRISMMVNSIPSAVILCTRVADSIEMRGRERELDRRPVLLVVLEERLGKEMMIKKLNRRFLIY
jgi:hypothetical protein